MMTQLKGNIRISQGQAGDGILNMPGFRGNALHEFQPRRGIKIKVVDGDGRSLGQARWSHRYYIAPDSLDNHTFTGPTGAGFELQTGYSGNAGEGFSTEAQGLQVQQILIVPDLAGGMALQSQHRIILVHAFAVINHLNEIFAAVLDFYVDMHGSCVQRVFD